MPAGSRPAWRLRRLLPVGLPEIEWFVDLGAGENGLTVFGGNFADGVTVGEDGTNTSYDGLVPAQPQMPRLSRMVLISSGRPADQPERRSAN